MSAAPKPTPIKPAPAAPASKMRLDALVKGKQAKPLRVLIFGPEGLGKSTFASQAPSPIFLGTEDGTAQLDVSRFQSPDSWEDVLEAIRVLTHEAHEFKTLVIDSADWLEPIIWGHVCAQDGKTGIEEVGGGYGKGYVAAVDQWRVLLKSLEDLRRARPMHIITIAHSVIKQFKNPEGLDYERYELKLNVKASGLLKEWHDAVLFTNHETFAVKDDKTKRVRGVSNGARLIYTTRTAAYDAKNRHNLPESLPLSWEDFISAVEKQQPADPAALTSEIQRKAELLGDELKKRALDAISRAGGDASKLAQLNAWCNSKLLQKEG